MSTINTIAAMLIFSGLFFFLAGTIGLLRLPDIYTRLHALTKADNLGLGLIVAGLAVYSDSWFVVLKMLFIWIVALLASSAAAHLMARTALRGGVKP